MPNLKAVVRGDALIVLAVSHSSLPIIIIVIIQSDMGKVYKYLLAFIVDIFTSCGFIIVPSFSKVMIMV